MSLATNWIFDHPELDLETPLEEELLRLEAEEDDDDEDLCDEEEEEDSDEEAMMRAHHHLRDSHHAHVNSHAHHNGHHHSHCDPEEEEDEDGLCDEQHVRGHSRYYEDSDEESETDSDDFDEEDIPEFKMVFVVNTSLEMSAGKVAAQVGHAALGVNRTLQTKSKDGKFKVSTTDLGLWQDFG